MAEKPLRVLIVGDSEADARLLIDELKRAGYKSHHSRVETPLAMHSALRGHSWDLVLSGSQFSHFNCLEALQLLKEKKSDIPFIIVSPEISEEMAIEAIKAGAHDCIKNRRQRLIPTIERELRTAAMRREHKQTVEELRRNQETVQQLATETGIMAEIGRLISSTLDIDEVYERFAAEARKLIPFDRLVVTLKKPQEDTFFNAYVSGVVVPGRKPGDTFPLPRSLNEVLLHTRTGLIVQPESIEEIADRYPTLVSTFEAGLRSVMSIPLISRDEVIGGLHFRSKKANCYTPETLRLAERIGIQIAGAIANAQLFKNLKKAEEEQREHREKAERLAEEMAVIAEIGRLIGSTLDIEEIYESFALQAKKLVPFDRLSVDLNHPDRTSLVVTYVSGLDIPERRRGAVFPRAGTISESISLTRTGLLINMANGEKIDAERPYMTNVATVRAGMRSLISVPLISRNEVIGTLHFRSRQANAYQEQDLRLAEKIGNQIAEAIANAQLIADLKNTERSLRESEGRFRALFEQAAVGTSETDMLTGRYIMVNRRLCEMVGRTEEEMLTTTFPEITHPEDRHLHEDKTALLLAGKIGYYSLEKRYIRKDGEVVWADVTVSPLWKPGEPPGRNIAVALDITGRKRLEEERLKLEERLRRAEKMQALGQLAGGVAHDLNNVLGVLVGYSELLLEQIPPGSPLRKYVSNIQQSGEKGAAIIQDLLTLARRGVAVSEIIDLNKVVSDYCETPEFENLQACHPLVVFKTTLDKDLLNIQGSPVHLNKTLMNLVSNAAEAISGKGEVVIRTENRYLDRPLIGYDGMQEGDYVILTVSDTGRGIAAADLEKIFEPFYTKKVMGRSGTGLGLTVVWGTVKDHRGYIDVQSEEENGSIFTLYFPVTRQAPSRAQEAVSPATYRGKGESILVVDDVKEQRELAMSMLTGLGYQVTCVSGGEEAVDYLRANRSDLIVLDMIMDPGIDGLETYRRILEIHPRQKAIIVSGFSETDRVHRAQSLGAGTYVRKPYVMEKIGLAIRKELDK
ncbi:MAG: response regulator [Deltaproteobacteria bacterium]|nr:response regulator [Deltaproteobacteria bacterium]